MAKTISILVTVILLVAVERAAQYWHRIQSHTGTALAGDSSSTNKTALNTSYSY